MDKQEKQINKNSQIQTIVGQWPEGKGDRVYGDGRWFAFGWWAHNANTDHVS